MRLGMSVTLQWMVITVEWMLKSQHRKSSLEKKIHPPLLMGLEPADFQSWVWNFTNGLSLLPRPQPVSLPARPNQSQRITDILLLSSHTVSSTCANIHTDLLEVEQYKNSTVDYNSKQLLNCFSLLKQLHTCYGEEKKTDEFQLMAHILTLMTYSDKYW